VFEHQARVIELDANYIGKLEQGTIRWPREPDRRAAFRAVLGVDTDAELRFRRPRRSRTTVVNVDRQQFLRAGLGITVAAAAGQSALAELITPTQLTPSPRLWVWLRSPGCGIAATAFAGWDARYGGGLVREAVNAQLRHCTELLNARCSERVRAELCSAVGYLGEVTAFMALDDHAHDDAHRLFRFASSCAGEGGDWHLRQGVELDGKSGGHVIPSAVPIFRPQAGARSSDLVS
jgi:hypothetical protein